MFKMIVDFFLKEIKLDFVSEAEIYHIIGVLLTNGFENDHEGVQGRAIYPNLSLATSGYLGLSQSILSYQWLYLVNSAIFGYLWLSLAISGYLRLSQAISGYLYQLSSIRLQIGAEKSNLLLFETFLFFFFHTGSIEELALLKTEGKLEQAHIWKCCDTKYPTE